MSSRFPTADELEPSEEEKQAARTAASAQGTDAAWGSGIGTVAGGALGALGILGGPELAALTIPAGMTLGGTVGNALGGQIGGDAAHNASDTLSADEAERQKKVTEVQLREDALNRLLARAGG